MRQSVGDGVLLLSQALMALTQQNAQLHMDMQRLQSAGNGQLQRISELEVLLRQHVPPPPVVRVGALEGGGTGFPLVLKADQKIMFCPRVSELDAREQQDNWFVCQAAQSGTATIDTGASANIVGSNFLVRICDHYGHERVVRLVELLGVVPSTAMVAGVNGETRCEHETRLAYLQLEGMMACASFLVIPGDFLIMSLKVMHTLQMVVSFAHSSVKVTVGPQEAPLSVECDPGVYDRSAQIAHILLARACHSGNGPASLGLGHG